MPYPSRQAIAITLLCSGLASCVASTPPNQGATQSIQQALEEQPNAPLNVAQVVPFEWDKFCFYGPYSDAASIETTTGFAWSGHENIGLESSDSFYLIAFFQAQEPVSVEKFPRPAADESGIGANRCYSPEESQFER